MRADVAATLSLAGRTSVAMAQPIPTRIGGFGGIEGLATYLATERIDVLIDATHPFAAQMARHAREAARAAGCLLLKVSRAPWSAGPGDRWHEVANIDIAIEALGTTPRRVFVTVGSLQLAAFARAPQHHYLVRTIDPVGSDRALPDAIYIEARGPFDVAGEQRLMRDHRIDILVTKNSGGEAASAKLRAARDLGIPVILLRRPNLAMDAIDIAEALAVLDSYREA